MKARNDNNKCCIITRNSSRWQPNTAYEYIFVQSERTIWELNEKQQQQKTNTRDGKTSRLRTVWCLVCSITMKRQSQQRALVFQVVCVKSTGISHKCSFVRSFDSTIGIHGNREVEAKQQRTKLKSKTKHYRERKRKNNK